MNKPANPMLEPDRNRLLVQGNGENEVVRLCPARHVHVDYGNLSLRFTGAEFIAFATMIAQATNRLAGQWRYWRRAHGEYRLDYVSFIRYV